MTELELDCSGCPDSDSVPIPPIHPIQTDSNRLSRFKHALIGVDLRPGPIFLSHNRPAAIHFLATHMRREMVAELVAEALGTFIIVVFGTGSVAMVQLFGKGVPGDSA